MDRDEIIRMARETGFDVNFDIRSVSVEGVHINKELERFTNLVAAHEREACARVCEAFGKTLEVDVGDCFAEEIRARGKTHE